MQCGGAAGATAASDDVIIGFSNTGYKRFDLIS
jgi:hypothetical protein